MEGCSFSHKNRRAAPLLAYRCPTFRVQEGIIRVLVNVSYDEEKVNEEERRKIESPGPELST